MYQVDLRAVWARLWALCRFGRRGAEPGVLLLVAVPQEREHSAQVAELFFASLHAFRDQRIACEIAAAGDGIFFRLWVVKFD